MPLTIVREEVSSRFQEARTLLSDIKSQEPDTGKITSSRSNIQKGFFIVLLYASLEYTVNRSISETSSIIFSRNVTFSHMHTCMYPLSLDPEFKAILNSGRKKKWSSRINLIARQNTSDIARLYENSLLDELGNIWCSSLEQIFESFGIKESPFYDPRVKQYIDEIVEKRNAVAHGRESPVAIGQGYTISGLEIRFTEIENEKEYIIQIFEEFIREKLFIKEEYRDIY